MDSVLLGKERLKISWQEIITITMMAEFCSITSALKTAGLPETEEVLTVV